MSQGEWNTSARLGRGETLRMGMSGYGETTQTHSFWVIEPRTRGSPGGLTSVDVLVGGNRRSSPEDTREGEHANQHGNYT